MRLIVTKENQSFKVEGKEQVNEYLFGIEVVGIFSKVVSHKGNVYRIHQIGESKERYLVTDGNGKWSHGDSLKEAGLKHDEIRKIINKKYEEALKDAVVGRLKEVAKLVREGRYSVIKEMISNSPAGDGYGCDNTFIDFSDVTGLEDIGSVVDALKSCKGE